MEIQRFLIDIGGNCQHRTINKLTISRGLTLCRKKPSTPIWSPPGLGCPMYKIELSRWKYPQSPPVLTYAFCIIYREVIVIINLEKNSHQQREQNLPLHILWKYAEMVCRTSLSLVLLPHCKQLMDYIQQLFSCLKKKECETLWSQSIVLRTEIFASAITIQTRKCIMNRGNW